MKTKILQVVAAVALVAAFILIAACGGGTATPSNSAGGVALKVAWKSAGALAENPPAGVVTVRMTVSGPDRGAVQQDFPAAARAGTIVNLLPGIGLSVTLSGLDASGTVTHLGAASNVAVQPGITTDVGLIVMEQVAPATYTLSGQVLSGAGTPMPGVTVTATGPVTLTTQTDANGAFAFTVPSGAYTVTAQTAGYSFGSLQTNVQGATVSDLRLTGTGTSYAISGRVTANNAGLGGVNLALSGGSSATAQTDANGYYAFDGLANGSYTVTPALERYTFTPATLPVVISGQSVAAQNFTALIGNTGQVQVNLQWSDCSDLDLHVVDPCQNEIYFANESATCGGNTGTLDVDSNVATCSANPAENVYWSKSPSGSFRVMVTLYSRHGVTGAIPYIVTTKVGGATRQYTGSFSAGETGDISHEVTVFTY